MNRKVILCDRYDSNRTSTVIADCTKHRMIITKRQLESAKRRSNLISGSYLIVSGDNNSELLEKRMEVYDEDGNMCDVIENY